MKDRDDTKPDLITFSTLIKGFCKERSIDQAFKVLNEMKRCKIEPDEVLFNSLLDGCFRSNEIDLAFRVH